MKRRDLFEGLSKPSIFVSYAKEDTEVVERLCNALALRELNVWKDDRNLLPGERWEQVIDHRIRTSDFFLSCLSSKALNKIGYVHTELHVAHRMATRRPQSKIFIIPIRLDDCQLPNDFSDYQWVDLFSDFEQSVELIVMSIAKYWLPAARQKKIETTITECVKLINTYSPTKQFLIDLYERKHQSRYISYKENLRVNSDPVLGHLIKEGVLDISGESRMSFPGDGPEGYNVKEWDKAISVTNIGRQVVQRILEHKKER